MALPVVRHDIDHEQLLNLYTKDGYSLRELQSVFHVCGSHLRATLNYLNAPKHQPVGKKRDMSDYDYYVNQQQSWYARGARRRGLEYNLTRDEFKTLIESNCHYCGTEPNTLNHVSRVKDNEFYRNGIDRVDNSKGYISTNVVSCCKTCNIAKNNMGENEFYEWIDRIYNHIHRKEE